MTVKSFDDFDRMDALCETLADAFAGADTREIDQAAIDAGLDPNTLAAEVARTIDSALNQSLKKKLVEAGQISRRKMAERRPDLTNLTREQLIEKLKLITANEDNAGEMLTIAARAGRGSMPVEELRSLIEDFYSISQPDIEDD
jgi:hypothetical protein